MSTNNLTNNILGEISSNSSSQSSDLSSVTQEKIKIFNNNEIIICPNINFFIKSKYQNLNNFNLGEYGKNKNLRKHVKEFIKNYEKYQKVKYNYDSIIKYSHSVSPRKLSSLPNFDFVNASSNISQYNSEEFEEKNKKYEFKDYIKSIKLTTDSCNNINNNYKYFIFRL